MPSENAERAAESEAELDSDSTPPLHPLEWLTFRHRRRLVWIALALGVMGSALLRSVPIGLNATLWTVLFLVAIGWVLRKSEQDRGSDFESPRPTGLRRWFWVPALIFGLCLAWRHSPILSAVALLGAWSSVSLVALRPYSQSLLRAKLTHYCEAIVQTAFNSLVMAFDLLAIEPPERQRRRVQMGELSTEAGGFRAGGYRACANPTSGRSVAVGLLVSALLIAVFGALFVSADRMFEQIVVDRFSFDGRGIGRFALFAFACTWLTGGFLHEATRMIASKSRSTTAPDPASKSSVAQAAPASRSRAWEVLLPLSALNLLFLAFLAVQFWYLFGGNEVFEQVEGLSYSEYAREGFFQLVVVTALTLGVLLGAHAVLKDGGIQVCRAYRVLALALVVQVGVVMASALRRMSLYVDEYGLTELRLYPTAFMGWIAVLLIWFVLTVLREKRQYFAFGALVSAYLIGFTLHGINPDRLIVQVNLDRAERTGHLDSSYLASLSPDAWDLLGTSLSSLSPGDRAEIAQSVLNRAERLEREDWRSWTISRSRALDWVVDHRAELERWAATSR